MPHDLSAHPVHLGLGATAIVQPEFSGLPWYADYVARTAADGPEGRLVSLHRFTQSWDSWEMHPSGEEVVICVSGRIVLHQQQRDLTIKKTVLAVGDYAINPRGVWHTADVEEESSAIFITVGVGTEHRPR